MAVRRYVAAAAMSALGLAVSGCGPGAGPSTSNVTVVITRNFGGRLVARVLAARVPASETVIELLERHLHVGARYDNDFVESIDGFSGTGSNRDWFYYVNGSEAPAGAGTTAVHGGDRIWWDLHDWSATDSIPAVVGSYPEPFTAGGALHSSTLLTCGADVGAACTTVVRALARAGVTVVRRTIASAGSGSAASGDATNGRPAIVVGSGSDLAHVPAAQLIAAGPKASGVYVRFGAGYKTLALLNPHGTTVTTLGSGAGLVAATAVGGGGTPTWVITGTSRAGVEAAARALNPARLHDVFALVVAGDRSLPVPRDPSS
jgi:hypothetical protein